MYLFYLCFTPLLAFHVYNASIRKNNQENMLAAKAAFTPAFFARRHPIYQEPILRDSVTRVQLPPLLTTRWQATESFCTSGVHKNHDKLGFKVTKDIFFKSMAKKCI